MNLKENWYKNLIAVQTIVYNEIFRFFRVWPDTILPPIITSALYLIIFGRFIGSQLSPIGNINYTQYIAPGLIMMAIITNSYANVSMSIYLMRFQKNIEEILIAPISNTLLLSGFIIGGILRGLMVGFFVTIITLFFTHLTIHHLFITLFITLLTAGLFSLAGFTNGIFAKSFDDVTIIPTFLLTPLTFLGGVFFSIKQLPPLWQELAKFNPILYLVNTFRYGLLGFSDVSIGIAFSLILAAILLLFIFNLYQLKKGTGIRS